MVTVRISEFTLRDDARHPGWKLLDKYLASTSAVPRVEIELFRNVEGEFAFVQEVSPASPMDDVRTVVGGALRGDCLVSMGLLGDEVALEVCLSNYDLVRDHVGATGDVVMQLPFAIRAEDISRMWRSSNKLIVGHDASIVLLVQRPH